MVGEPSYAVRAENASLVPAAYRDYEALNLIFDFSLGILTCDMSTDHTSKTYKYIPILCLSNHQIPAIPTYLSHNSINEPGHAVTADKAALLQQLIELINFPPRSTILSLTHTSLELRNIMPDGKW